MQAERDSLTGLSEVPVSRTPSLVPTTGGWYSGPNQALELHPQEPGLTQLRHKLGLPLQRPVHQAAALQQTHHGDAANQGAGDLSDGACQPEVDHLANCSYEVGLMASALCCSEVTIPQLPQVSHVNFCSKCLLLHSFA